MTASLRKFDPGYLRKISGQRIINIMSADKKCWNAFQPWKSPLSTMPLGHTTRVLIPL
jgi:hypothetical protein